MITSFTRFIEESRLFQPEGKVLLAVSGGMDSMVMWKLFEDCGFDYAVIHCNFQLRGDDSDADEALVRHTAEERGIRLFVKPFDTRDHASVAGISIEMAARELRYAWFREVMQAEGIPWLATAHHLDDLLETFFINLVRKTGIRGLTGFKPQSGQLVRPMLFTNRASIAEWATQNSVVYRTDQTNHELIFQRNYIRHQIIPALEKLNPSFRRNLAGTMSHLREVEEFYDTEVNRQLKRISGGDVEQPEISISALMKMPHPRQLLFEWMSRYGFNQATVDQVFKSLEAEPGRRFFSRSHRLITDRNRLIITEAIQDVSQALYLERNDLEIFEPVHLTLMETEAASLQIDPDPRVAYLDADKLQFPLVLRKWQPGEYFQPFGMEGFKKLSDFFIDQKFSIPEKEQAWIICSSNQVVWIVGHRIDNRFRITGATHRAMIIRLHL